MLQRDDYVDQLRAQAHKVVAERHERVMDWISRPKPRRSLEGKLEDAILQASNHALDVAIVGRDVPDLIEVEINLEQFAAQIWGNLDPHEPPGSVIRSRYSPDDIRHAFSIVARDAGYEVRGRMLVVEVPYEVEERGEESGDSEGDDDSSLVIGGSEEGLSGGDDVVTSGSGVSLSLASSEEVYPEEEDEDEDSDWDGGDEAADEMVPDEDEGPSPRAVGAESKTP